MTKNYRPSINFDSIIAIIFADLFAAHARNDLRDSIDAADDLRDFASMNLDDARDADDLYAILDPFDRNADLLADLLRDRYDDIIDATIDFLRDLDY